MVFLAKIKIIFNEIALSKVIQNFSWLFFDRIIRLFVGFFVSVLVARYLGVESFGKLSYAVAYTAFFQAISNFGVDSIVVRDMAKDRESSGEILINVLKLKLITSSFSVFIGVVIILLFLKDQMLASLIVIFSILFSIGNVVDLLFQSQSLSRLAVLAKFKSYLICLAIKVAVILFSLDEIFIFISISLEAFLSSVFIFNMLYKSDLQVKIDFLHFNLEYIAKLIRESWPLAISSVSIIVFMKSGIFFIENKLGFDSVGIYSIGVSLAEMTYMLPMLLLMSFAPVIAKAKEKGETDYKNEVSSFFRLMYIGSMVFVLCVGVLGYSAIPYIYGIAYIQSKYIFLIHIFTLIPVALGCAQSVWLVNERLTKVALYQTTSTAVLIIFLNFILIDEYGIMGAAFATLIAQLFQSLLVNFFFCRPLFKLTWKTIFFR